MDTLEYHEIVEADHRILNPLTDEKLALLAQICRLEPAERFDLGSCIGATWIDGGSTIAMLRKAIKPGGLILIGEPY